VADFTQADKDAIDSHLRSVGVVESTEFADQKTKFRPLDDILKLRAITAREANAATTGGTRSRFAAFRKGV
jgi:hypothetical protein